MSHGYNGAFTAVKIAIDLKTVNWLGRFTGYSGIDIPVTEIFNMLGVDLLNSQEFSVSDELVVVEGGVRFWIWKNIWISAVTKLNAS